MATLLQLGPAAQRAHHGKSPMERYFQLGDETPYSDEAYELYEPSLERIQNPNYKVDLELREN